MIVKVILRRFCFRPLPSAQCISALSTAATAAATIAAVPREVSCSEPEPEPSGNPTAPNAPGAAHGINEGAPVSERHYEEMMAAVLKSPDGQALIHRAAVDVVRRDDGARAVVEAVSDIRRSRAAHVAQLKRAGAAASEESTAIAARAAGASLQAEAVALASGETAKAAGQELPGVVRDDPFFRRLLEEHRARILDELRTAAAREVREIRGEASHQRVREAYFAALEARVTKRVHVAEAGCRDAASSAHVASYWTTALGIAAIVAAGLTFVEATPRL